MRWILCSSIGPHPYCSDSHRHSVYRTGWVCGSQQKHVAIESVLRSPLSNLVTATLEKSLQHHVGQQSVYKAQSACKLSTFSHFLYPSFAFCSVFCSICFVYVIVGETVSWKHLNSIEPNKKINVSSSVCMCHLTNLVWPWHLSVNIFSSLFASFHVYSSALDWTELHCPGFPSLSPSHPLPSSHLIYPHLLSSSIQSASFTHLHFSLPYLLPSSSHLLLLLLLLLCHPSIPLPRPGSATSSTCCSLSVCHTELQLKAAVRCKPNFGWKACV